MSMNHDLKTAMNVALRTTEDAKGLGRQLSAGELLRGTAARRVSDAHERAVREAKELADAAANLVVTLQCDGINARYVGHNFAAKARRVSGALIRLTERREVFEAAQAHHDIAGLLPQAPANGENREPGEEPEESED
jgi:hypothetical protein